ncbi:hypothetical protein DP187_24070, partial [Enterobacter cloacae]
MRDGETPASVASAFGLTNAQLQAFNQFRSFRVPFSQLGAGDEIDVPVIPRSGGNTESKLDSEGRKDTGVRVVSRMQDMDREEDNNRKSDAAGGMARSMASGAASDAMQQWMNNFGKAQVNLNMDEKGSLNNSAMDWLLPVHDTADNLLFTQIGARNKDERTTVNLGWGWRTFTPAWMFGFNNFYDNDLTGNNHRVGLGVEARTNYLQFAGNTYLRLNNWHQSRDFADYDERPANGFDIRAQGWLPAYPQLGGKLMYEQYYGNNVALFSKDNLQSNPYAVTAGVNWTPFPLVTVGLDHRMGKGGQKDNNINLQFNWRIGESLSSQLASDSVASMRLLESNRYDIVDRNNNIILEYRKQTLISQSLSVSSISGPAGSQHPLNVSVSSKYGVKTVTVDGDDFISGGGRVTEQNTTSFILTLPPYQAVQEERISKKAGSRSSTAANIYVLTVKAEDTKGNVSPAEYLTVEVLPPELSIEGELQVLNDNAPANNTATVTVSARIVDSSGNPVSAQDVTFTTVFADGSSVIHTAITDAQGLASTGISSLIVGKATVAVTADTVSKSTSVHFVADAANARVAELAVEKDGAVADGTAANRVRALITDARGNPVSGASVAFTATNGATVVPATGTTGPDGLVIVPVTGTRAGTSTITAVSNDSSETVDVQFVADGGTARVAGLAILEDGAVADGTATNSVQALVTDAHDNPVVGAAMTFTTTNGAVVPSAGITASDGTLIVNLTSTRAGASTVTAVTNGTSQSADVQFVADAGTARVTGLTAVSSNAVADGTAANSVQAIVTDASGNPVSGAAVAFTATNGATVAPATGTTGADGRVTVTLTSTTAGTSTVTAAHNGTSQSADVQFVADAGTARVTGLTAVSSNAVADGTAANSVQAIVTDASGNPVSGAAVAFTATNGAILAAATGTTGADGRVTVTLTSTTAGTSTVTAAHNGTSQSADVQFVADAGTARVTGLTAVSSNAVADGTAANSVQAVVTDAHDNPVSGAAVAFTATNGAILAAATGTTGADGRVTVTLTSTTAGTSTV